MRIGIDLMGSDRAPEVLLEALWSVCEEVKDPGLTFVAIATPKCLSSLSSTFKKGSLSHIEFVAAPEFIEMDEPPLLAVRRKKNSTMAVGMRLIKEKSLDAFLSTGNTGALVATSMFYLDTFRGIDRAALLVSLPTLKGQVAAIDVGANLHCKKEHFIQFANLAIGYQKIVNDIDNPKIGLLNIGAEEAKGTEPIKEAYLALQEHFGNEKKASFIGNVEGRDLFYGVCDIILTDGFTGNIFLKTAEGVSSFILEYLKKSSSLSSLPLQFDYSHTPGALLIGIDGLIIKCHGDANLSSLIGGIKNAISHVRKGSLSLIKNHLRAIA